MAALPGRRAVLSKPVPYAARITRASDLCGIVLQLDWEDNGVVKRGSAAHELANLALPYDLCLIRPDPVVLFYDRCGCLALFARP